MSWFYLSIYFNKDVFVYSIRTLTNAVYLGATHDWMNMNCPLEQGDVHILRGTMKLGKF